MSQLSPTALLDAWEDAVLARPVERAIRLLRAIHPERSQEQIEQQGIAERDTDLLEMRETLFGAEFRALASCPNCDANTELLFQIEHVRPVLRTGDTEPIAFRSGCFSGTIRLPISGDWLALPTSGVDGAVVRDALAKRCLLTLTRDRGQKVSDVLPSEVLVAVGEAIAQHDSDAHTKLDVVCPACGYNWTVIFDIASYLWREVDAACRRLLDQVHRLARAYGWAESEILGLSVARRECYLSIIENG
jgi:hypothetical protein